MGAGCQNRHNLTVLNFSLDFAGAAVLFGSSADTADELQLVLLISKQKQGRL